VVDFDVGTDGKTRYVRESRDYRASLGSPVAILTASSSVGYLAADINGSSVVTLFYSVGATVYSIKRTSGTWGSATAWSNSVSAITGLACHHRGDWNVIVAGQNGASEYLVWSCVFGDGYSQASGVWSTLEELTKASAGSGVEFQAPFVTCSDVYRTFFIEKYTGVTSYSRPLWAHSLPTRDFKDNRWREPVPFNLTSSYGTALAHGTSQVWLSTPSGVWKADINSSPLDLSPDVIEVVARTESSGGQVRVTLRNDDGRYNNPGSGAYELLDLGAELVVGLGYKTSTGDEFSSGPNYWIERWTHTSKGGRSSLVLQGREGWGLLERWRARRQYSWAAGEANVFKLLSFIMARAGLDFSSLGNSPTLVNHYPAFTVHPGEDGARVVRRLLEMVPDVVFFRNAFGYVIHPQASDTSVYSYGSDHVLAEGRYEAGLQSLNRTQVYGDGVLEEGFDWDSLEKVYEKLRQVVDLNLDTSAEGQDRVEAELRRAEMAALGGHIVVPTNCGQEVYDVVDITDARVGLLASKRRVMGIRTLYASRDKAAYEQTLELGGV
jgi:hypothetical protein